MALFEFDFFIKSCRQFIGIIAWTWAILVFCLSYLGRGNYNHINNNNEYGPPPLYQTVFVPILKVLLVAPSAALAGPIHQLQQQQQALPQFIPWNQVGNSGGFIYCAGCGPLSPQQLVFPANSPLTKSILAKSEGVNNPVSQQQQHQEPGKGNGWEDGVIPVQQMSLSDDGRYSFSYNTADASRQEERNLDGSVSGSYSYTDPEGKLVQIDYTAGASGYKAYGENVPPSHPVVQLPQPVQDTPEVQQARAEFLETYNRELARIQQDAATATSTSSGEEVAESSTTVSVEPAPAPPSTAAPSSNADGDTVEVSGEVGNSNDQDDAVVLSGKSESSGEHKSEPQDITSLKTALDNNQAIAVPVNSPAAVATHGVEDSEDEENEHANDSDSIVISADDEGENKQEDENNNANSNQNLPSPSYSITIPVGVGPNAGLAVVQQNGEPLRFIRPDQDAVPPSPVQSNQPAVAVPVQQDVNANTKSNLLPYFYYVSVGGSPHYVTNTSPPGFRSPYPTSLQASLLGAIPLAARHDTQIPNRGANNQAAQQYSNAALRPVFLDLENSVQEQQQQQQQQQQNQQPSQISNTVPLQFAGFGGNSLNFNNNHLLGQIVPLGSGGAGISYIPALILNVGGGGGGGVGFSQQNSASHDGSQNNVPTIFLSNVPQQQTATNQQQQQQPMIAFSKK
ncbi:Cuticle protein 6 [Orchesella cincta]|uniref:Cuticle protein 6 n=1 Tax=Orchesella cincta TaxID=48709 RepID=A0A1D2MZ41_ORCCI|nr:Cuticle protein 6 [Orchesella cincta]